MDLGDNLETFTNSQLFMDQKLIAKLATMFKKPSIEANLSGMLESYLQKLNKDREYLSNGIFKTNFAEAGLLVENSATIYGKKIDLLWDETNQFQKHLCSYDKKSDTEQSEIIEERMNRFKRRKKIQEQTLNKESVGIEKLLKYSQEEHNLQMSPQLSCWDEMNKQASKHREEGIASCRSHVRRCRCVVNNSISCLETGEQICKYEDIMMNNFMQQLGYFKRQFGGLPVVLNEQQQQNEISSEERNHWLQIYLRAKDITIDVIWEKGLESDFEHYLSEQQEAKLTSNLIEKSKTLCPKNSVIAIRRLSSEKVTQYLKTGCNSQNKQLCLNEIKTLDVNVDDQSVEDIPSQSDSLDILVELSSSSSISSEDNLPQNDCLTALVEFNSSLLVSENLISSSLVSENLINAPVVSENLINATLVSENLINAPVVSEPCDNDNDSDADSGVSLELPGYVTTELLQMSGGKRKREASIIQEQKKRQKLEIIRPKCKTRQIIRLLPTTTTTLTQFEKFYAFNYIRQNGEEAIPSLDDPQLDSDTEWESAHDDPCEQELTTVSDQEVANVCENRKSFNRSCVSVDSGIVSDSSLENSDDLIESQADRTLENSDHLLTESQVDSVLENSDDLIESQVMLENSDELLTESQVDSMLENSDDLLNEPQASTSTNLDSTAVRSSAREFRNTCLESAIKDYNERHVRLKEWNNFIKEKLKTTAESEFKIHEYESRILHSIPQDGNVGFEEIASGKSASEVTRLFLASLQLATTNNIDLSEMKKGELTNNFQIKLLSKDRYHEHLNDYQAPSEESLQHKLKKMRKLNPK